MAEITKADFYEAAEKFFPVHDIVFEKSYISDRQFTNCMVGERLVMRYCPPLEKYGMPTNIIVFTKGMKPLDCITGEDLITILTNGIEQGDI